jgi:hypothetical protein
MDCKPSQEKHETHAFSNRVNHGLVRKLPTEYLLECLGEDGRKIKSRYFEESNG